MCLDLHDNGAILLIVDGQFVLPNQHTFKMKIERPTESQRIGGSGNIDVIEQMSDYLVTLRFHTDRDLIDKINNRGPQTIWLFNEKTSIEFRQSMLSEMTFTTREEVEVEFACTEFETKEGWMKEWS